MCNKDKHLQASSMIPYSLASSTKSSLGSSCSFDKPQAELLKKCSTCEHLNLSFERGDLCHDLLSDNVQSQHLRTGELSHDMSLNEIHTTPKRRQFVVSQIATKPESSNASLKLPSQFRGTKLTMKPESLGEHLILFLVVCVQVSPWHQVVICH